jgi:SagB-type dehydrogenase family enzyme
MHTDRRGFLGLLAGAVGVLALPRRAQSVSPEKTLAIHRITRNTRAGAIGRWLTSRGSAPPLAKEYARFARVALPTVAAGTSRSLAATVRGFAPAVGFEAREIPFTTVARLLHQTNGITGELVVGSGSVPLRAAPSAGALYAGEVYLAAERVRGLAPGLYHFAVLERALVRLREGPVLSEIVGTLEAPDRVRGAAFAVLHSNVFARYGVRYGNRGYRYALIDTGHIAENLRLAAAAEGFGEIGFTRFEDEPLDALLGVDGRAEAVCFVSAVGVPAAVAGSGVRGALRLVEIDSRAAVAPGHSVLRYHQSTRLVRGEGGPGSPVDAARSADPGGSAAPQPRAGIPGDPLPSRTADPSVSVELAIRARRSPLVFVPEAIDAADLAFVLAMARGDAPLERAPGVELFAIVHRVRGVAPGLYASDGRRIALRRAGDLRDALTEVCLGQDKAGLVAAALLMVAQPAEAAARSGPRAYRDLLIESGAIGQRIYLAAESVGLAARNLAAFRDDDLDELLGFGPDGRAVLHLTLLGRDGSDVAAGRNEDAIVSRSAISNT